MTFAMLARGLMAMLMCSAMTVWAVDTNPADANDPTKQRYCDPVINAEVLSTINALDKQLRNLPSSDPQYHALSRKLEVAPNKLKCTYRPIPEINE